MNNLAAVYESEGKSTEAAVLFRQVLEIGKRVLPLNDPETQRTMKHLANLSQGAGRWEEALTYFLDCSRRSPEDTQLSLNVAALQAWLGHEVNFVATCRMLLERANGTSKASTADRAAKVYCLLPSSDPQLLETARTLARRAVDLGKTNQYFPYYLMGLGMAEYRSSGYPAADEALTAAELAGKDNRHVRDTTRFFRAMSLFRQGNAAEARQLFAEAEAEMKPLPTDERQPFTDGASPDDLIVWLAYKEAKALLHSPR